MSARRRPSRPRRSGDRGVLGAWLVFLAAFGASMAALSATQTWVEPRANAGTAVLAAAALRLLGESGQADGALVHSALGTIEIIWECTGVTPVCIFLSAVLAFPTGWRARALGALLGVPALLALNLVRVVSLAYVARHFPSAFETVHVVVWQSLIVLLTVLLWLTWTVTLARRADPA